MFAGADASKSPALSIPGAFLPVAFSPDGADFVYAQDQGGDNDLRIGRICRGTQVIAEFKGDLPILCRWMQKLAVAAGEGRDACDDKRIAVIDWPSGGVRYLTDKGNAAVSPAWSPDGKRIAWSAAPAVPNGCGGGEPTRQALSR